MISSPTIHRIGSTARRILSQPDFQGEVIASVRGAIYIKSRSDEVLWMAGSGSPMHARSIQLSTPLMEVSVGTIFTASANYLHLGSSLALELDGVPIWDPPQINLDQKPSLAKMNGELKQILPRFLKDMGNKGFGIWMTEILNIPNSNRNPSGQTFANAFHNRTAPLVKKVLADLRQSRLDTLFNSLAPFVGLGEGLTPSGDDFVGGLLFTLHCLEDLLPDHALLENLGLQRLISAAKSCTNLISWTLLKDLSQGKGNEQVHSLINLLLSSDSMDGIHNTIRDLVTLGHSTGVDLLAGILAGLQVGSAGFVE